MKRRYRMDFCLSALVLYVFIGLFFGSGSSAAVDENMPAIQFDILTHHFGDAFQNEEQAYSFRFRNTGNRPLKIMSVEGT